MYRRYTDGVPHPPLENIYDIPDSGGIPDKFVSLAPTCRKLSDELLDFLWYRGWTISYAANRAGISYRAAEDLIRHGKGADEDLFALCDALNVELLVYPSEEELEKGAK